jgi:hypothetical protein
LHSASARSGNRSVIGFKQWSSFGSFCHRLFKRERFRARGTA